MSIGSPELLCVAADDARIGMLFAKLDVVPRNGLLLRGGPTEAIGEWTGGWLMLYTSVMLSSLL